MFTGRDVTRQITGKLDTRAPMQQLLGGPLPSLSTFASAQLTAVVGCPYLIAFAIVQYVPLHLVSQVDLIRRVPKKVGSHRRCGNDNQRRQPGRPPPIAGRCSLVVARKSSQYCSSWLRTRCNSSVGCRALPGFGIFYLAQNPEHFATSEADPPFFELENSHNFFAGK
jgi:hypothetical protein